MTSPLRLFLFFLSSFFILLLAAQSDLTSAGEARVAEIAREMVERRNFILPSLNELVSAESMTKPPLFHWTVAMTGHFLGWGNFTVRLPILLSALASALMLALLAKRLAGLQTAAFSLLVFTTSLFFLADGATLRMDLFFATLILAAMLAFVRAVENPEKRTGIHFFYFFMGCAILTKGPAGVLLPLFFAVGSLLSHQILAQWRRFLPMTGILLLLAVVLPWYVAAGITAPPELAENFLFGQLAHWWKGGSKAAASGESKSFFYYLPHLFKELLPWSLFLPGALILWFRQKDRALLPVLFWFLGGFLLFSLGGKKATRYLIPLLPGAALFIGWYLAKLTTSPLSPGHQRGVVYASGLIMTLFIALFLLLALALSQGDLLPQWVAGWENRGGASSFAMLWHHLLAHWSITLFCVGIMATLSIFSFILVGRGKIQEALSLLALLSLSSLLAYHAGAAPVVEMGKSPRIVAEEVATLLPADLLPFGGGTAYKHAFRWYLGRNLTILPAGELLQKAEKEKNNWFLLMTEEPLPDAVKMGRDPVRIWHVDYYDITLLPGAAKP